MKLNRNSIRTVAAIKNGKRITPSLRISGVRLSRAGFKPGQRVSVSITEKEIVIKPVHITEDK